MECSLLDIFLKNVNSNLHFNGRLLERRFLAYRLKGSGAVRRTVGQKRPLTQEGAQASVQLSLGKT